MERKFCIQSSKTDECLDSETAKNVSRKRIVDGSASEAPLSSRACSSIHIVVKPAKKTAKSQLNLDRVVPFVSGILELTPGPQPYKIEIVVLVVVRYGNVLELHMCKHRPYAQISQEVNQSSVVIPSFNDELDAREGQRCRLLHETLEVVASRPCGDFAILYQQGPNIMEWECVLNLEAPLAKIVFRVCSQRVRSRDDRTHLEFQTVATQDGYDGDLATRPSRGSRDTKCDGCMAVYGISLVPEGTVRDWGRLMIIQRIRFLLKGEDLERAH